MACNNIDIPGSRREFLSRAGSGFGAVALSALAGENLLASSAAPSPVAAKIPPLWKGQKRDLALHGRRPQSPGPF